jgi:hypothetical protein
MEASPETIEQNGLPLWRLVRQGGQKNSKTTFIHRREASRMAGMNSSSDLPVIVVGAGKGCRRAIPADVFDSPPDEQRSTRPQLRVNEQGGAELADGEVSCPATLVDRLRQWFRNLRAFQDALMKKHVCLERFEARISTRRRQVS